MTEKGRQVLGPITTSKISQVALPYHSADRKRIANNIETSQTMPRVGELSLAERLQGS